MWRAGSAWPAYSKLSRKQSPKPTWYIRTRTVVSTGGWAAGPLMSPRLLTVGVGLVQYGETLPGRHAVGDAEGLVIEQAVADQVTQPAMLAPGIADVLAVVVLGPAELVEHDRASAEHPDARARLHGAGDPQAYRPRQRAGRALKELDVLRYRLRDHDPIGADPDGRADVLDVDVEARVDLEELEVFPDEPEDLVGVAAQRRVAEVAVDGGEAGVRQVGDVVVVVRDAPPGERIADGDPVAVLVVRDDLGVGDQQGRQEVRELELDRREVIDRPHAHAEQVLGRRRSFLGCPGQAHRAGEADVLQAFAPDPGQGLQDDPHQDLAAEMRLVVAGIAGPPGRGPQRDGVAQGAAPLVLQRRSDLLRQGEQRVLLQVLVGDRPIGDPARQVGMAEQAPHHLGHGEHRQQRHDVRQASWNAGWSGRPGMRNRGRSRRAPRGWSRARSRRARDRCRWRPDPAVPTGRCEGPGRSAWRATAAGRWRPVPACVARSAAYGFPRPPRSTPPCWRRRCGARRWHRAPAPPGPATCRPGQTRRAPRTGTGRSAPAPR